MAEDRGRGDRTPHAWGRRLLGALDLGPPARPQHKVHIS